MASTLKSKMIEIPERQGFHAYAQKHMNSGYLALGAAYQSYQLGRSTNSASILLLGMSGAGKSHTINNLFSKEIAPVGEGISCTKDIVEFTIKMPSEHVGISNAKIHVIDTPGFGDTEGGIEFDARVLANIHRLFQKKTYKPNFIILAANINDKRLEGPFAPFVKLLQAIKRQLKETVLDTKHPNLIVVLTHLCGAMPKLQKDPSSKKILVQKIIHENLGIPNVPVEVAENCFGPDDYDLKRVGDYVELPNKELFPRNLYQSMVNIAKAKDPVGHGIINEAYPKLQVGKFPISKMSYPIVEDPSADLIVSEIMQMQISKNTELGERLSSGWSQLSSSDRSLTRLEPTQFGQKLAILGYKKSADLPRTRKDTIHFFREVAPDKGMETLLRSIGLEAPEFSTDLYIGRAYDLTKDRTTSFSVLSPGSPTLSTVGCYLPQYVQGSECPEVKFTCNVAHTAQEAIQQRLKELKIQASIGKLGFNFEHRDGYNMFSQGTSSTLTAVYEKRLIKLELKHSAPVSPELDSAVRTLPNCYNKHDTSNVNQWKTFFSTYGTHYINTSYIGGCVVFKLSNVSCSSGESSFQTFQGGLSGFLKAVFVSVDYKDSSSNSTSSSFSRNNLEILVRGGNSTKASKLAMSNNQKEFAERLSMWEDTIWENPMVTDSSIGLAEIANVVSNLNPSVVNALKNATDDLYNARLEYEAKPVIEPTRQNDSEQNRNKSGGNCLTPETLISTPEGVAPIITLKRGDLVINQKGHIVKVIGVNKVYSLGHTNLYGFQDSTNATKPFFTSGHTFVSPTGKLLVQNKYSLERTHPQMKSEFDVEEMPSGVFEIGSFDVLGVTTKTILGLTSTTVDESQELYFLAVEGDGTYIANGFVCYHELPKFEAWPKTFAAIYGVISAGKSVEQDLTLEGFKDLANISEEIKAQWEILVNNTRPGVGEANEGQGVDTFEGIYKQLGSILQDSCKMSLGLMLYSRCGEFLHRYLDIEGLPISPFVQEAHKVLQAKF